MTQNTHIPWCEMQRFISKPNQYDRFNMLQLLRQDLILPGGFGGDGPSEGDEISIAIEGGRIVLGSRLYVEYLNEVFGGRRSGEDRSHEDHTWVVRALGGDGTVAGDPDTRRREATHHE